LSIILSLLLLTVIVGIHEYAHLWAAQRLRVPVEQFSIGMGPALLKTSKGGVEYVLRILPLGGFVSFKDDYSEATIWWKKVLISLAGPVVNLVVAVLALFVVFSVFKGPASGLEATGRLMGMFVGLYGDVLKSIFEVLTFQHPDEISGPVGIVSEVHTQVIKVGFAFTAFAMFVGLNLGVGLINLAPLPLLDGGRAMIALLEPVIGKAKTLWFDRKVFSPVGFVLLLAFVVLITFNDVVKITLT
jgi:regulator of sigma E protease